MSYKILPPVEAKNIHIGCACCSTACQVAHMNMLIAVGFGQAQVTKGDELIWDEMSEVHAAEREDREANLWTVQDAEDAALKDPDHDRQIIKMGPLHGEAFQRQGVGRWVCIESNPGFA
jgi:hypothetical protein